MRAHVIIPPRSPRLASPTSLYTYHLPERLVSRALPGTLVAVPFGERIVPGVLWSLDSDTGPDTTDTGVPLRQIAGVLIAEPILLSWQRALAEWIAEYYAAPVGSAVRLMLPPGLLRGVRTLARAEENGTPGDLLPDEAAMLALIRSRGAVAQRELEDALGRARVRTMLAGLARRGFVTLHLDLTSSPGKAKTQRLARVTSDRERISQWRDDARARLDQYAGTAGAPDGRQNRHERASERILRQLAVLDVLTRAAEGETAGEWRVEDLRRLTRATESALNELVASGLITIETMPVRHDPLAGRDFGRSEPLTLSEEQAAALTAILDTNDGTRAVLVHGITGSGKTEVYLQALAAIVARGEQGIVLVPEIALTPQTVARFAARFPGRVALLHSGLSDTERVDEWWRIRTGQVDVVIGSRSALFAPVERLGLIILDEEHEGAYKQSTTPTYHAREVAVRLGELRGARVVLGSATPSVESYWHATNGTYRLAELRRRAPTLNASGAAPDLPPVSITDLRAELRAGNTSILSGELQAAMRDVFRRGEQSILFLNRRGMANGIVCRECGFVVRCEQCDVSMTYHASDKRLICHYCGRRRSAPDTCPVCWSASIRYFGIGTERVEQAVKKLLPQARVLRWDRDTAKTRQAHEELLRAFAERRADVLVGTQMIAKGLDLPGVTLVGVVAADIALNLPDFRASERAFQLLTQVAGRAGRGTVPGRVIVQTFNPEHFCIETAAHHDYAAFYAAEAEARQRFGYPPFRRFVKCTYEHTDRYTAQVEATILAERLEDAIRRLDARDADIVGPAPAFMERLRGRYRWQVILRAPDPVPVLRALSEDDLSPGWAIDVDPTDSL